MLIGHAAPASPLERVEFNERMSPHTPQESILPPDPSGLSISGRGERQSAKPEGDIRSSASMFPPATPTAGRDNFHQFGDRRSSITPFTGFVAADVDESLTSRFEKVEFIGTGEFSQVYRVTQTSKTDGTSQSANFFEPGALRAHYSPLVSVPNMVYAVKKTRKSYAGSKDRGRKLQEVNILKELGHTEHIIHLVDSWEAKNHLYIQTEFCEEGGLDLFLSQVGQKARLDDFRIWKILLELSL